MLHESFAAAVVVFAAVVVQCFQSYQELSYQSLFSGI